MKYKMEVDVSFIDKLNETIEYQKGDIVKTPVDEKRKEDLVVRKLAHVVEEAAKKLAEEEEAKKKAEEEAAKKKASENPTTDKK